MGPRLSTGGNSGRHIIATLDTVELQWGPVSRRGGTEEDTKMPRTQ